MIFNNIDVIFTREEDKTLSLSDRVEIANNTEADLFVSLHCNAADNRQAKGIETYCYQFGGQGERAAYSIQGNLDQIVGRKDRGVKSKSLYVIRKTEMPAALNELCFISNPDEEHLLSQDSFLKISAEAIAKGICEYFLKEFKPIPDESQYIIAAQQWVQGMGISDGLRLEDNITRGEFYVMLMNYYNLTK